MGRKELEELSNKLDKCLSKQDTIISLLTLIASCNPMMTNPEALEALTSILDSCKEDG